MFDVKPGLIHIIVSDLISEKMKTYAKTFSLPARRFTGP